MATADWLVVLTTSIYGASFEYYNEERVTNKPRDINMTSGGPFSSDPGNGMATLRMQRDDVCCSVHSPCGSVSTVTCKCTPAAASYDIVLVLLLRVRVMSTHNLCCSVFHLELH